MSKAPKMSTYKKGFKCTYCRGRFFLRLFFLDDYITGDKFSLNKCENCGLIQTLPRLSVRQLTKYYRGYREKSGKRFLQPVERLLNHWHKRRVDLIKRYNSEGVILDVGCGRGAELELFRENGWITFGTEFDPNLKKAFLEKGLNIYIGNFWDAGYKKDQFDAVTLWHSLEHLSDTKRSFEEFSRIIKAGGLLVVAVPNFNSIERRVFGRHWFHLDVPRHLTHFSDEILVKMLNENGFKILSKNYIAPEFDYYSFWQSFLNEIFRNNNLLYRFLNKDQITNKTKLLLLSQLPCLVLIAVLSLFIIPITWILRKGGTVEIVAQKK